jgi:hypothetical protein
VCSEGSTVKPPPETHLLLPLQSIKICLVPVGGGLGAATVSQKTEEWESGLGEECYAYRLRHHEDKLLQQLRHRANGPRCSLLRPGMVAVILMSSSGHSGMPECLCSDFKSSSRLCDAGVPSSAEQAAGELMELLTSIDVS